MQPSEVLALDEELRVACLREAKNLCDSRNRAFDQLAGAFGLKRR